jgi:hypothetical protein
MVVWKEVWSFPRGSTGSESSFVSQHSVSVLIDTTVMLMQSSADPTIVLRSDTSRDHVIRISSPAPYE